MTSQGSEIWTLDLDPGLWPTVWCDSALKSALAAPLGAATPGLALMGAWYVALASLCILGRQILASEESLLRILGGFLEDLCRIL